MSNRFRYVCFMCDDLYYDAQEQRYVCASNGKSRKKPSMCKSCARLKVVRSDNAMVDLRGDNGNIR